MVRADPAVKPSPRLGRRDAREELGITATETRLHRRQANGSIERYRHPPSDVCAGARPPPIGGRAARSTTGAAAPLRSKPARLRDPDPDHQRG